MKNRKFKLGTRVYVSWICFNECYKNMFICFGKRWLNKGREDEVSWEKMERVTGRRKKGVVWW